MLSPHALESTESTTETETKASFPISELENSPQRCNVSLQARQVSSVPPKPVMKNQPETQKPTKSSRSRLPRQLVPQKRMDEPMGESSVIPKHCPSQRVARPSSSKNSSPYTSTRASAPFRRRAKKRVEVIDASSTQSVAEVKAVFRRNKEELPSATTTKPADLTSCPDTPSRSRFAYFRPSKQTNPRSHSVGRRLPPTSSSLSSQSRGGGAFCTPLKSRRLVSKLVSSRRSNPNRKHHNGQSGENDDVSSVTTSPSSSSFTTSPSPSTRRGVHQSSCSSIAAKTNDNPPTLSTPSNGVEQSLAYPALSYGQGKGKREMFKHLSTDFLADYTRIMEEFSDQ